MKRKNLPTILLVVVAVGLISSMFFQLHLLNEISYLWTELDETYELLLEVLKQLKEAKYGIQI